MIREMLPLRAAALVACLFAPLFALTACRGRAPKPTVEPSPPAVTTPVATPSAPRTYGQPLTPGEKVPLATVLQRADSYANRAITVEGRVRQACSRKGCWMEIADSTDKATPGCRVTFKNYGFFVPTDAAGSHTRVQGVVEVSTVKASMVRHLEEEGAVFASKQPDGTAREVRIVATGVELWRRGGE